MAYTLSEESLVRDPKFNRSMGIGVDLGAFMKLHALRVTEEIARLYLRPGQ